MGEIEDEHDQDDEPTWSIGPDGVMDADARLEIVDFEKVAGVVLSDEEREEIDTLGGLVFSLAGRAPQEKKPTRPKYQFPPVLHH